MKTNSTITLLALATLSPTQTTPAQWPPLPHRSGRPPIEGHANPNYDAGRKAEARGDLASAERYYRAYIVDDRDGSPFAHVELARLFDRMGRDREAYAEYRAVVVGYGDKRGWSSDQENPVVLARFGDLACRFGTVAEARTAYSIASEHFGRDGHWDPVTTPRTASLRSLKSAAHTAAACALFGWPTQEKELRTAIEADPNYWVPHFYLAQTLPPKRHDEALREARLASGLAPATKHREMVTRMRENLRLLDAKAEDSKHNKDH